MRNEQQASGDADDAHLDFVRRQLDLQREGGEGRIEQMSTDDEAKDVEEARARRLAEQTAHGRSSAHDERGDDT